MSFKNKTVIVTGGGTGIGAAIAMAFAKEEANVVIVGRRQNHLAATAEKCAALGKDMFTISADISKDEDAVRIIKATVDKFGRIDILVNNAAISRPGSVCKGDILQAYDAVMNTNLRAVMHLTALATPHLIKTKGNVVNISSVLGTSTSFSSDLFVYSVSKAALSYFTKCAAFELAPHGVRVNTVSPGPVETDILVNSGFSGDWSAFTPKTALNRLGDPQEIADVVLFIASSNAKSITGSDYLSDNGFLLKV